ncbi:MAG: phosphopantothenate/pantothenate synthetase [Verrucomicrobiales bacterium]|nr:phosphopantothenate/pantothenate synthetase [Verrucomicrobiales bacterium]
MVPTSHPRYISLMTRDRIVAGVERGVTSIHGLIAHGRGEAFDYLLGERTHGFAEQAIAAAAALLRSARHPVLSINGNVCALAAEEMAALATACGAPLEVNIFHTSDSRERAIRDRLLEAGAPEVLMPSRTHALEHIDHNRRWVHPDGIWTADVVFVPLEDGDRCQALVKNGKQVITVDLNPMSRTARTATITIVDNLVRCLPLLIEALRTTPTPPVTPFNNAQALHLAEQAIRSGTP